MPDTLGGAGSTVSFFVPWGRYETVAGCVFGASVVMVDNPPLWLWWIMALDWLSLPIGLGFGIAIASWMMRRHRSV